MSTAAQVRVLLVEELPEVAQHVRSLLDTQQRFRLVEVVADGARAVERVTDVRPDIVLVDALLRGRTKGADVALAVRQAFPRVPVVALTVKRYPVDVDPARGVDRVLVMPITAYDLLSVLRDLAREVEAASDRSVGVIAVYAPKGGVGKTTVAFNLAAALGREAGLRTVLVDGSLQFADLRGLLRAPDDARSIHDLPIDRVVESDLTEVVWRDPSGIDVLFAPPRAELAETISSRDLEKVLAMLRRVYEAVVVDLPVAIDVMSLAFLDAADRIVQLVTGDSTTLHNTRVAVETFGAIGYPPEKLVYVLNRADSPAALPPEAIRAQLGRDPDFSIVSDGRVVVEADNQGVSFVVSDPGARVSRDVIALARALAPAFEPAASAR